MYTCLFAEQNKQFSIAFGYICPYMAGQTHFHKRTLYKGIFVRTIILIFCFSLVSPSLKSQNKKTTDEYFKLLNNEFNKNDMAGEPFWSAPGNIPPAEINTIYIDVQKRADKDKYSKARMEIAWANIAGRDSRLRENNWRQWAFKALASAERLNDPYLIQAANYVLGERLSGERVYDSCVFYEARAIEMAESLGFNPSELNKLRVAYTNNL